MVMRRTGCEVGHGALSYPTGYAVCDLWSAESRFTPSQQLGKWIWALRPNGHWTSSMFGVVGFGWLATLIVTLESVTVVEVHKKETDQYQVMP
jgi:hypothetical protein